MRNLKKFLALVLAMMMTLGLMVTANASVASDFTDAESITKEFTEAVAVLEGLDVFTGYENGTFQPKKGITRAEVATIVYRLATGDVEGKQADLYKDYQNFKDVASTDWYAGYVNYCANAEWIKGYGDGTFGPNKSVTGYQAAAMILRAVGYGKNGEFNGTGWQVQVANYTRSLGLLKNVDKTTYANTLNQAAPRELVAEILFQAGLIDTVTWTQMNGYRPGNPIQGATYLGNGLAWQNFKLNVSGWQVVDDWGRPGYYWFKGNTLASTLSNVVAEIDAEPVLDLEAKAWKECEVAEKLNISTSDTFRLFVNRNSEITTKYLIEATDTVTNVGGQGRITEFYGTMDHPWENLYYNWTSTWNKSVTMIDTYLATVTQVTERVLDPAGHVIVPSYLYLNVHDGQAVGAQSIPANDPGGTYAVTNNTSKHRVGKSTANWEYAAGDKVLVQGYTDYTQAGVGVINTAGSLNHGSAQATSAAGVEANNRAAFETNRLKSAGANYANDTKTATNAASYTNISVLKKAEPKIGKQTVTYWNRGMHTVDGTDYNDQMTLFLDVAGTTTNTTFAWYFDDNNNIIGIDTIPDTVNYGVITSIYSAFDQGESATTGTAKAVASVLYADGTTGTVNIDRFLVNASATGHAVPGSPMKANPSPYTPATFMTAGSAELIPVYDYSSTNVMGASSRDVSTIAVATQAGYLHVAPVAAINAAQDTNDITGTGTKFGIVRGNMFKFVASTDGNMTAIEVAGDNNNDGVYDGHYNKAVPAATGHKLYKNYSYIDLTSTTGANADVRLDADTRIMIKIGATAVSTYTLDTLPGDVTLTQSTEVDWADTDGDNRAEYVYLTGSVVGTVTYGLFYYNGGAAQWNGTENNGTLFGWLNGEPTTLTFGKNVFNAVKDHNTVPYNGHLFAVQMTNGVVSALMYNGATPYLVSTEGTAVGSFQSFVHPNDGTVNFVNGVQGSNPYNNTTTNAVYLKDVSTTSTPGTDANVSYDPATRTIIEWVDTNANGVVDGVEAVTNTYYLNGNSKVIGLGMGVNQESAILDYLNKSTTNDVTIVYEQSGVKSIVEIYVATDPNVTPPTTSTTAWTATLSYNATPGQIDVKVDKTVNGVASGTDALTLKVYAYRAGADASTAVLVNTVSGGSVVLAGGTYTGAVVSGSNNDLIYYVDVEVNSVVVTTSNSLIGTT